MIGFTMAIGDLMAMLAASAMWVAAGIAGWLVLGAGVIGGGWLLLRRARGSHRDR